jgi:hypothetical protein
MMVVFEDCSKGRYVRSAVESGGRRLATQGLRMGPNGTPVAAGSVTESRDGTIQLTEVRVQWYLPKFRARKCYQY